MEGLTYLEETVEAKINYTKDKGQILSNLVRVTGKKQRLKMRLIKTCMLCWSFVSVGLIGGQIGPTLLDLQEIAGTTLTKISAIFTATGVGYITGSLLAGNIVAKVHADLVIGLACLSEAFIVSAIPWCSIYEVMIMVNLLQGVANGFQDTAVNTVMVRLWKKNCASVMQALHFSFAIGAIISPLYTASFLSEAPEKFMPTKIENVSACNSSNLSENVESSSQQTSISNLTSMVLSLSYHGWDEFNLSENSYVNNKPTDLVISPSTPSNISGISSHTTRLYVPFTITATMYIPAAFLFIISYLKTKNENILRQKTEQNNKNTRPTVLLYVAALISILFTMLISVSIETAFRGLVATFSVKLLNWSKMKGSYISSVFSASFCAGRFLGIFIAKRVRPSKLIIIYILLLLITLTGFLLSSLFRLDTGIWVTIALAGISTSTIFPGIFSWTENDFFRISGRITSLILVSSASGWMLNPLLVGYLMDNRSPMYFCYVCLGECVLLVFLYLSGRILSRKIKRFRKIRHANTFLETIS